MINVKKLLIIALVVMMVLFTGCSADKTPKVNEEKPVTSNEVNDTDKFFPEDKIFTAQLLYEYMVEFEEYQDENGTQQTYIFDLRSADEYAKGHVYGAVNLSKEECADLFDKLYTDCHVLFIGEGAEELAEKFRELHNAAYAVQGGYEAIEAVEGMDKYITTKEFKVINIREVDDEPVESKAYSNVVSC